MATEAIAFFNETNPCPLQRGAAAVGYRRTVGWLDEHVAGHGHHRGHDSDTD